MKLLSAKALSVFAFTFVPRTIAFKEGFLGVSSLTSKTRSATSNILRRNMASFRDPTHVKAANPHNFSWQQTMLRIKDPKKSVPFYKDHFGFTLIHQYDFPQWYLTSLTI